MTNEVKKQEVKLVKPVSSKKVALSLVEKMIAYEEMLDGKHEKTPAEARHVEYLRALRRVGLLDLN